MPIQSIAILVLFGVLATSVVWFCVLGAVQKCRTARFAREAHRLEMRFSAADPFDVPRRYAGFALTSRGHGPAAHNVTHGRVAGRPLRAYEFRYEIGHGPRRTARHYHVVVIESAERVPEVLMWNDADAAFAPLSLSDSPKRLACWTYRGDDAAASAVGYACDALADRGVSMESRGRALMLCEPAGRKRRQYGELVDTAAATMDALQGESADA